MQQSRSEHVLSTRMIPDDLIHAQIEKKSNLTKTCNHPTTDTPNNFAWKVDFIHVIIIFRRKCMWPEKPVAIKSDYRIFQLWLHTKTFFNHML